MLLGDNMNKKLLSEKEVCKVVTTFFKQNRFNDYTVHLECPIQFGAGRGRKNGIADVVLKDADGHWITIIECKSEKVGDTPHGRGQLRSYLSGTDTRLGILAFNDNPDEWIYCENQRANKFRIIPDKSDFEEHILDPPTADRTDQAVLKRLKQRLKFVTIAFISAFLIIVACISIYFLILLPMHSNPQYQVVRIIDGDTFEIKYKGKLTSVQLIGVDAPETMRSKQRQETYGEEATEYLQDFLLDKVVNIHYDETERDKHDRILGYVYRASDGIFVNLEIIREGYAEVDLRYPFKYKELFTDYESRAKKERIGLWEIGLR